MKRLVVAIGIALVGLGYGCGRSTTAPSSIAPPAPPPAPAPPLAPQTLNGYVSDTAFRPMAGVRLDVVTGPDTGKELTSDERGFFSYAGMFSNAVSIRATKEGYVGRTSSVFSGSTSSAWVSFTLAPLAPPVAVDPAGSYTLTMTVDSACAGFPDDLRTRSFAARLTKRSGGTIPADTRYDGTVSGAQFAQHANIFWVGVAGDYVAVTTEGEGPSIIEQVGPRSYMAYTGVAGASALNASATLISAPFKGLIEYCEFKSPMGQYYDCTDALAEVRAQCTSGNSSLSLTRQ